MRIIPGNILVTAASDIEMKCLENIRGMELVDEEIVYKNCSISRLITGLGGVSLVWTMMNWLRYNKVPDISLNIGIAGSYNSRIAIGDVVVPFTDCFADQGLETKDSYKTLWESGLSDPDSYPFSGGVLFCTSELSKVAHSLFPLVKGISVNTVSGNELTINKLKSKFKPDIETMEGASYYYVCNKEKIPCLGLRAISNSVEPRNRDAWNIDLALNNLSSGLESLLTKIIKQ